MSGRRRIVFGIVIALLAGAALSPWAWRAGSLYWAKYKARQTFSNLTPADRAALNSTPASVTLPNFDPDSQPVDAIDFGSHRFRVLRPTSQPDRDGAHVRLTYPTFQAIFFYIGPLADDDVAAARQLQFKDEFDFESAAYHTRLDDLEALPDLASFPRFLSLIHEKGGMFKFSEEFARDDVRGFIVGRRSINEPFGGSTKSCFVNLFFPASKIHLTLFLNYDQPVSTGDAARAYVAVIRVDPKADDTTRTTTRTEPATEPAP
jgi:hypothetical protein